jgi:hypothetical protein
MVTDDRKKPGVVFWAIVPLVCLVLYVLSIGPAAWLVKREILPLRATAVYYRPVVTSIINGPNWLFTVVILDDPHVGVIVWKMRYALDPLPRDSEPTLLSY